MITPHRPTGPRSTPAVLDMRSARPQGLMMKTISMHKHEPDPADLAAALGDRTLLLDALIKSRFRD